jgi:threonylcarbamoyladenosine tRNA methylthiotransferase MtaB
MPVLLSPPSAALQPLSVQVETFGCRLNAFESEQIKALATEAGLLEAVVVNTCAVTAEAVRQARQTIRRTRRERPNAQIIVTGCAAQIDPESFAQMPEVDHVIGNIEKMAATTFQGLAENRSPRVLAADIGTATGISPRRPDVQSERTRAFVEVQNGCDHRCTFCVIPYGRGNSRSAPAGTVVGHVAQLAAAGVPEIVLTGVDLTSWGADLPGKPSLGNLVARILKLVPDLPRLRLSSLDAIEMDPQLFELIVSEERIAPYLHLSLQHGHDLILKRMKRRHSRTQALDLIARLRAGRSDIAFGADLIAGFPTETEEHAAANLSLIEEAQLSFVHVFPYSPRPMTPAANMPALPQALVKARAAALRRQAQTALCRHLDQWVGQTALALVEEPGAARLPDFTPVRLTGGVAGTYQLLRFEGHDGRVLTGSPA